MDGVVIEGAKLGALGLPVGEIVGPTAGISDAISVGESEGILEVAQLCVTMGL